MSPTALFVTVLVACMVEAVEAATVVLAVGTTRHWRSTLQGTGAALVALAAVTAILGPAIATIPLDAFRVVIGTILLLFGLQWLRKAVLRASGYKALRDEDAAFRRQVEAARGATVERRGAVADWYSFTVCFKAVLLEGLEVVLIVITFGNDHRRLPLAVLAAAVGVAAVVLVTAAVRAPLSRMPENAMKLVVGILLTGYGTFWAAEGAGASWPGGDAALLWLIPGIAAYTGALVAVLRLRARRPVDAGTAS